MKRGIRAGWVLIKRLCPGLRSAAILKLCGVVLLISGCITAGNSESLRSDVNQLKREVYAQKREVTGLRKGLGSLEGKSAKGVTKETLEAIRNSQEMLYDRLTGLSRNIQLLQGKFDEKNYAVDKALSGNKAEMTVLRSRVEEMAGEVKQLMARVQVLEKRFNALSTKPPTEKKPIAKQAPVTETGVYRKALDTFRGGKYKEARKQFKDFFRRYPDSDLSDNAQFWIAESYYKEGVYEDAILAYETLIRKFPKSDKVPGAMLKQAYSFLELGDKNTTKVILSTLKERFPKSKEAKLAEKKLQVLDKNAQQKKTP
ncbi:MAG TPA: tol-pal system protein YbgF [Nitrospirae bacterium]|nr:tol-pal system protein YbgF [Nitrospirota bacterium]